MTELAAPPAAARQSSLSIFRHRDFTVFFTAAAVSNGANWMQLVAVPALLFDLTNSGAWLGFATFSSLIPAVLLTPYAGVLTDRVSRQAIVLVTQTAQMVIAFGLWGLYTTGHITPWWIIGLGILNGCATGFQTSAWQTFVPLLVPEDEMLHAVKLNSVQFTMARAIGPAAAGWVVAAWGVGTAIFVNAATYLLVIIALLVVHARPAMSSSRSEKVWAQLKQGARYVWTARPAARRGARPDHVDLRPVDAVRRGGDLRAASSATRRRTTPSWCSPGASARWWRRSWRSGSVTASAARAA